MNILLVDDEEKIIEVLEAYLKKEGFSVFSCSNGEEALKIFDNNKIDLILLDLMLPDLSGEEVCKVIRAKSCVPIIMITAKTEEEDLLEGFDIALEEAAMDLGATPFQTFTKITLPVILPGVIAGALLAFTLSLDDVIISFFVT